MTPRALLLAATAGTTLAALAGSVRAEEVAGDHAPQVQREEPLRASPPPAPGRAAPALEPPATPPSAAPGGQGAGLDLQARLRTTGDGLSLEVGGARFELRLAGDGEAAGPAEPFGPQPPGARDFRATFSLDGKARSFLLRFVPPSPPREEAAPAP